MYKVYNMICLLYIYNTLYQITLNIIISYCINNFRIKLDQLELLYAYTLLTYQLNVNFVNEF